MIEKVEIKINKIKEKINPKVLSVGIFMIFGAISIFAMEMTNNFKRQKQQVQDEYNKSMYEIVGYVNSVETELAKLQITTTPRLTSTTLASIWRQANLAKANLESLPVDQNAMSNASKYLSQLSDFSYSLMKQTMSDEKITDEQYSQIKTIYKDCVELSEVMQNIYNDLNTGTIKWDELKKDGNKKLPQVETVSNIDKIGKTFQEYEGLIYDGAFSDHILNMAPKYLKDKETTVQEAKDYISTILFDLENIESINQKDDSDGIISLYNFNVKTKDSSEIKNISITKKDCKLYLMLSDRKVAEAKISMEEAKQKGLEYLKKIGIDNVKDTYYLTTENMAIINYAAIQDEVIMYPDLIKVKVALDNGQICSVESQGYIFNHTKRENILPTKTIEEAKSVLNKNIEIQAEDIAVIPTESKNEVLTYEFKGKIDEKEFLIYINANTLEEEKVLLILETPGGVLTM